MWHGEIIIILPMVYDGVPMVGFMADADTPARRIGVPGTDELDVPQRKHTNRGHDWMSGELINTVIGHMMEEVERLKIH